MLQIDARPWSETVHVRAHVGIKRARIRVESFWFFGFVHARRVHCHLPSQPFASFFLRAMKRKASATRVGYADKDTRGRVIASPWVSDTVCSAVWDRPSLP